MTKNQDFGRRINDLTPAAGSNLVAAPGAVRVKSAFMATKLMSISPQMAFNGCIFIVVVAFVTITAPGAVRIEGALIATVLMAVGSQVAVGKSECSQAKV
jgi:hypothetical protein